MAEQTCSPHWKSLPQRSIYANNLQDSIPTKQSECSEDDSAPDSIASKADDPISSIQQLGNSSGYEYLDHTADVQIHCWGNSWESAFAAAGLSLFGYMTDLKTVKPDPEIGSIHIQAQGHDLYSLLYKFLDECLFQYGANYIILCQLEVTRIQLDGKPGIPCHKHDELTCIRFVSRGGHWTRRSIRYTTTSTGNGNQSNYLFCYANN